MRLRDASAGVGYDPGWMRIVGWIVLWVLATSGLAAAERWIKLETPNFEVYTTGGEGSARRTLLYFEKLRSFFLRAQKLGSTSDQPVRIIGFKNAKQFEPFRPNEFASAYYLGAHDRDYIVIGDIGLERHETAIHEYVHLLVKHSEAKLPVWLNEGMAEVYATMRNIGKKVQVGDVNRGRIQVLYNRKWLPTERLIAVGHDAPEYNKRAHSGMLYAQSWALTHMLSLSGEYGPRFNDFLNAVVAGKSSADALQEVYGKAPKEIGEALKSYVRGGQFYLQIYDVELEKSALTPTVSEASELEAGLVLAQLQASTRRGREAAVARYRELGEKYPEDSRIPEALGYLAWRTQDRAGAVEQMKRAAELGSDNPRMYYDLSGLARGEGEAATFQTQMLEKAIKLKPDYLEARRILGSLYLNQRMWGKALQHLNRVNRADTNEEAYTLYHGRAYAYYRLGALDDAKKMADLARGMASGPAQIDAVVRLAGAIDFAAREPEAAALAERQAAELAADADTPPVLHRRPPRGPEGVREDEQLNVRRLDHGVYEGVLLRVDCEGESPALHVNGPSGVRAFLIDQPENVVILGDAGAVEFTCGPQDDAPVRVEFEDPTAEAHLDGRVRVLEFQTTE